MRVAAALALLLALPCASAATSVTVHAGTSPDGTLYFRPEQIRVAEGERVTLTLVNDDPRAPHDWALLEYGGYDVEGYVEGGETVTIAFSATETGTFRFVCQVVGHKQRGMEGTLVVEDRLLAPGPDPMLAAGLLGLGALALRRARA